MTTEIQTPEERPRRRWVPHAVWAAVAVVAFAAGAGTESGGDEAPAATATPEPAPTVTVTAGPEVIEVDPAEETLAEIADREAALDEREATLDQREEALDARTAELNEREEALGTAELEIEEGTIPGTGLFLVGEDVQPGTYRGDGSGGMCYWARLSGTSGELGDVIANGLPDGPTVVTIRESDVAFETQGCADWVRQ